jgi:hypothetical protein
MKRFIFHVLMPIFFMFRIPGAFGQGNDLLPTPELLYAAMPQAVMPLQNLEGDIPSRIDLGGTIIPRGQGALGACASFACAAELTRTIRLRNNWPIGQNRTFFSPSYLYNQASGGRDMGSSFPSNLDIMTTQGCALYTTFPYTLDVTAQPGPSARREAARYRISQWQRLPGVDLDLFKVWLAKGFGILASLQLFDDFYGYEGGIYHPTDQPRVDQDSRFRYHGVLIVGYDDEKKAIRLCNSWSTTWGDGGFMYVAYDAIESLIRESYILIPPAELPEVAIPSKLEAGRGACRKKIPLTWEDPYDADYYEIFRLEEGAGENYQSLGRTRDRTFEDADVEPGQVYFYMVAAHRGDYMSELSLAAEGWVSHEAAPGIPGRFRAALSNNHVTASWDPVENAVSYNLYFYDTRREEFVLAGETTGTRWYGPIPQYGESPSVNFMVTAENEDGESMPSNLATLVPYRFQPKKTVEVPDEEDKTYRTYRGSFYQFPFQKFYRLQEQLHKNFIRLQTRLDNNFRNRYQRR